jgi:hypothetical protein
MFDLTRMLFFYLFTVNTPLLLITPRLTTFSYNMENKVLTDNQPKWKSVCLPFFPFPFFPVPAERSGKSSAEDPGPGSADEAQALAGCGRRSSQRTVPRVSPAMRTFGLGAAGKDGNASESRVLTEPEGLDEAFERDDGLA